MKKVGLVFGGGAARCFAHLGVFDALKEAGIPVSRISCTSAGALVGALLANNVLPSSIKHEFYKKRVRMGWLRFIPSLSAFLSQKNIIRILDDLLPQHKIEKSKIALDIIATDAASGKDFVFSKGSIKTAVCAAMAYPGIFRPLKYKNRYLIDGGITNCIPADVCRKKLGKKSVVVSIKLESPYRKRWEPKNYIQILARSVTLSFGKQRFRMMEEYSDFVLEPLKKERFAHTNLNFLNTKRLEHYYRLGKKEGQRYIRRIKEKL